MRFFLCFLALLSLAAASAVSATSVRGTMWSDCANFNGLFDRSEAGLAGNGVLLYKCSGAGPASEFRGGKVYDDNGNARRAVTDENGVFQFDSLPESVEYVAVKFRNVDSGSISAGPTIDSDFTGKAANDQEAGPFEKGFESACVHVGVDLDLAGDPLPDQSLDLGVCLSENIQDPPVEDAPERRVMPHAVCGVVWEDCAVPNGLFDTDKESAFREHNIGLYRCSGADTDGSLREGKIYGEDGNPVVASTDSNGIFVFASLAADIKFVSVTFRNVPAGATTAGVTESPDSSSIVANDLANNESEGAFVSRCIAVGVDLDSEGRPLPDQHLDLGYCPPNDEQDSVDGTVSENALRNTVRGTIWEDCKHPNGLFDAGEAGAAGKKVLLYHCSGIGNTELRRTKVYDGEGVPLVAVTDENGVFEFTDLPDEVLYVAVKYRNIDRHAQTHGVTRTGSNTQADNDVETGLFESRCVAVGVEQFEGQAAADQNLDFGFCVPGSEAASGVAPVTVRQEVVGHVWEDCYPPNGRFDEVEETFVENISVEMFVCNGFDTPIEARIAAGRTTVSDANGNYQFLDVDPSIQFVSMRFVTPRKSTSAGPTTVVGDGAHLDNDVSDDDIAVSGVAWSPCVPPTREYPVLNQDADLGFCPPCPGDLTACNDPHFTGFLGQRFEFHGISKHVYSLVSSPHLQYNARFNQTKYKHNGVAATFITEMGLLIGPDSRRVRITFPDWEGTVLKVEVDGVDVPPYVSGRVDLSEDGSEFLFRTGDLGLGVYIATRDFVFHVRGELRQYRHINDGLKMTNWEEEFVAHGLLGQTGQMSHATKETREVFADFEWPTFLDGQASDYDQAGDIFGTSSKFNMYQASE